MTAATLSPTLEELHWFLGAARTPELRSIRQFAEEEIILPEGKYQGRRWRVERQPYAGLLFDCLDAGPWTRRAFLGPVQSGKTLHCFVVPTLYSIFEQRELTTILGVPTMELGKAKWQQEILPVIERSRYRDLLPSEGRGSRGGWSELITFQHGCTLQFMSGHGGDEKRSGVTARVVNMTEVDKFDTAGQISRETDPISQLEDRTLSYDDDEKEVNLECTVSIAEGRIWQEYQNGTASRIIVPCPHCGRWVSPEREHLQGWQEAETKMEARRRGHFCCPACGEVLTDQQRVEMNRQNRLVHRGQEITPEGEIVGEPIETDTLGFRWSAFNNLFWTPGTIAAREWAALRAPDEENAKKELVQFFWAVPYQPPDWDTTPLDPDQVRRRFGTDRKGFVPPGADYLTVTIDPGKRVGWWMTIAWWKEGSGHIVDYGTIEIPSDSLGVETALMASLRDFRDEMILEGWLTGGGELRIPDQVWIDAGYKTSVIFDFIHECNAMQECGEHRFRPVVGRGAGQLYRQHYTRPKKTGATVRHLGQEYHIAWIPDERIFLVEVNADSWKSSLHDRLATPIDQPGALSLYHSADRNEHISLAKHFTAERLVEEFVPGKGVIRRWIRERRKNHFLDTGYLGCAAGHLCGVRLTGQEKRTVDRDPRVRSGVRMPDGRPYLATERK